MISEELNKLSEEILQLKERLPKSSYHRTLSEACEVLLNFIEVLKRHFYFIDTKIIDLQKEINFLNYKLDRRHSKAEIR
jgi:hypothetical protein